MSTRKRGLFFSFRINSYFKFKMRISSAALAPRASLHGKHSRTCWTLPVTSCSCPVYLVPHGRNHPAGNYSLLPDPAPHVQAAMTSLTHKKKKNLAIRGILHASTRALPCVTCTVHSANRTHRAGHAEFHTRAHVQNPSVRILYPA